MVKSKPVPRILLADDSTHAQRMGTKILAAEGIEVVTASNGEAALKKMGEVEVDLVLADVYMPGLEGYEVCQWVKKSPEYSFVPVVLVVGALELYEPDKIAQVQADGLLKKPFEATAMIDTLRPLLEVAAKAREKRKPKPVDAPEERTVRLAAPVPMEEEMPAPAPVEAMEVPAEQADIPYGMDMPQDAAASATPEIDLSSVEFAMPGAEPTESAEVTIPTEFQESAPAPAPAQEAVAPAVPEPEPEPAPRESVYGVEAPAEEPVEVPVEATPEVIVEEAPQAAIPEPEPEPPAPPPPPPSPPPPEPTPHWVAEPAEVTKQDQARFEPAAAPPPPAPEAPPDWNELLKSVEGPAASPAVAAAAAAAVVAAKKEEEPAPTPPPPPAPEPVKVDEDAVRTAVQLCLESALPALVEEITASVIRRLNK